MTFPESGGRGFSGRRSFSGKYCEWKSEYQLKGGRNKASKNSLENTVASLVCLVLILLTRYPTKNPNRILPKVNFRKYTWINYNKRDLFIVLLENKFIRFFGKIFLPIELPPCTLYLLQVLLLMRERSAVRPLISGLRPKHLDILLHSSIIVLHWMLHQKWNSSDSWPVTLWVCLEMSVLPLYV